MNKNDIWKNCRLSGKPLIPPLFSDCKGHLFNKEAILEWLLVKPQYKAEEYTKVVIDMFSHIKLRKDLVELTNLKKAEDGSLGVSLSGADSGTADLKLGSHKKFGYIDVCGHVNALSALQKASRCCVCGAQYSVSNIVIINPSDPEDIERLRKREEELINSNLSNSRKPRKRKSGVDGHRSTKKKRISAE